MTVFKDFFICCTPVVQMGIYSLTEKENLFLSLC